MSTSLSFKRLAALIILALLVLPAVAPMTAARQTTCTPPADGLATRVDANAVRGLANRAIGSPAVANQIKEFDLSIEVRVPGNDAAGSDGTPSCPSAYNGRLSFGSLTSFAPGRAASPDVIITAPLIAALGTINAFNGADTPKILLKQHYVGVQATGSAPVKVQAGAGGFDKAAGSMDVRWPQAGQTVSKWGVSGVLVATSDGFTLDLKDKGNWHVSREGALNWAIAPAKQQEVPKDVAAQAGFEEEKNATRDDSGGNTTQVKNAGTTTQTPKEAKQEIAKNETKQEVRDSSDALLKALAQKQKDEAAVKAAFEAAINAGLQSMRAIPQPFSYPSCQEYSAIISIAAAKLSAFPDPKPSPELWQKAMDETRAFQSRYKSQCVPPVIAAIALSGLTLAPTDTVVGTPVTVKGVLKNTGNADGVASVSLMINGVAKDTKSVPMGKGATRDVSFTYRPSEPGTISVSLRLGERDPLTQQFLTVKGAPVYKVTEISTGGIKTVKVGAPLAVDVKVANTGTADGTADAALLANGAELGKKSAAIKQGAANTFAFPDLKFSKPGDVALAATVTGAKAPTAGPTIWVEAPAPKLSWVDFPATTPAGKAVKLSLKVESDSPMKVVAFKWRAEDGATKGTLAAKDDDKDGVYEATFGPFARIGKFLVSAQAVDTFGSSATIEEAALMQTDVAPPLFEGWVVGPLAKAAGGSAPVWSKADRHVVVVSDNAGSKNLKVAFDVVAKDGGAVTPVGPGIDHEPAWGSKVFDPSTLAAGEYTLRVIAEDKAGNKATDERAFRVVQAPVITLGEISPKPDTKPTTNDAISVTFDVGGGATAAVDLSYRVGGEWKKMTATPDGGKVVFALGKIAQAGTVEFEAKACLTEAPTVCGASVPVPKDGAAKALHTLRIASPPMDASSWESAKGTGMKSERDIDHDWADITDVRMARHGNVFRVTASMEGPLNYKEPARYFLEGRHPSGTEIVLTIESTYAVGTTNWKTTVTSPITTPTLPGSMVTLNAYETIPGTSFGAVSWDIDIAQIPREWTHRYTQDYGDGRPVIMDLRVRTIGSFDNTSYAAIDFLPPEVADLGAAGDAVAGAPVKISAQVTDQAVAGVTLYHRMGDGTYATLPQDGHGSGTYEWTLPADQAVEGDLEVYVTARDEVGNEAVTDPVTIRIKDPTPPSGSFDLPADATAGSLLRFSAADLSEDAAIVEWDFGDASAASGRDVAHVYAAPGSYTVTMTLRDADDNAYTSKKTLKVVLAEGAAETQALLAEAASSRIAIGDLDGGATQDTALPASAGAFKALRFTPTLALKDVALDLVPLDVADAAPIPGIAPPPGEVAGVLSLRLASEGATVPADGLDGLTVAFTVDRAWLDAAELESSHVRLARWTGNGWAVAGVREVASDANTLTFEADVAELTRLVIVAKDNRLPPPPEVTVTIPTGVQEGIVTIEVVPKEGSTLTRVNVFIDGENVGSATQAPWRILVDTGLLTDGEHDVKVISVGKGGRVNVYEGSMETKGGRAAEPSGDGADTPAPGALLVLGVVGLAALLVRGRRGRRNQ